ncbi:hypothetical protein AB664_06660 [Brucella anthropi]|uniref:Uncharacterized protein n=1 Tax=Brucella anthropi TaxID=529 RepID=A0A656Z5L1_BRUAN|nr:hypothetical protein AB664_06660 [Brucella anthropi]
MSPDARTTAKASGYCTVGREIGAYVPPAGTTSYFTVPSKLGVFGLEMIATVRGETINSQSYHIPPDPLWLDCARIGLIVPVPIRAVDWARRLCDSHMLALQTDKEICIRRVDRT